MVTATSNYSTLVSTTWKTDDTLKSTDQSVEITVLPVITKLGNQSSMIGSSAAPGCAPCWVACLANPAWAPFCAGICAAMCVSPLSADSK